jgi:hypothetical protein
MKTPDRSPANRKTRLSPQPLKPSGKEKKALPAPPRRKTAGNASQPVGTVLWEQRDKSYPSLTAICSYGRPHFTVRVRHDSGVEKSESFLHTFEPIWGIDVSDQNTSIEVAVRLSDQLAAELRLTPIQTKDNG